VFGAGTLMYPNPLQKNATSKSRAFLELDGTGGCLQGCFPIKSAMPTGESNLSFMVDFQQNIITNHN